MPDNAADAGSEHAIQRFEPVAGPVHTFFLLVIMACVAAAGYFSMHRYGAAHHPKRVVFYLITMAWEWIMFGYVYWGLRRRGKFFGNMAGTRWKSAVDFFRDLGIAFGFWIAAILVLSLLTSVLHTREMTEAARLLAPRGLLESVLWVAVAVTAGICEETIFRGYLQRQFVAWIHSAPIGVVLSAVLFGAGHIYQGGKATVVIAVYGLMFGTLAEVRQNLRPGMMVHAWHDAFTGLIIRFVPLK